MVRFTRVYSRQGKSSCAVREVIYAERIPPNSNDQAAANTRIQVLIKFKRGAATRRIAIAWPPVANARDVYFFLLHIGSRYADQLQ